MLTQAGNFVGQSDTNAKTGKTIAIATLHWTQLTLVSLLQCLSQQATIYLLGYQFNYVHYMCTIFVC